MGLNPKGRNWGSLVNWDDLGKAYAGFTIAWSIILYSGVAWLLLNRHLPFIKIRNLPLAIAAVSFLHVYLVKILLAYTVNGHFLCSAEFWIMSIYLPFGIALFQANLFQLKSISDEQQKLVARHDSYSRIRHAGSIAKRWAALPGVKKAYVIIGFFMAVQLVVTGALYGGTPTLRGDWSSFGNVSHAKGQGLCRKSLQWIPSAFWQLTWSWFYGPYIIFTIRNIRDVHYWRLQVILSVVCGLPGAPLWLAALYSPSFKRVNKWWVPPMWLAPGIVVMQFATIFFPIYEAFISRRQMRTTLAIIKDWDKRRLDSNSDDNLISGATSRNSIGKSQVSSSNASSRRRKEIYTVASLEKALAVNPIPLLQFAATKDFTAENVLFLMQLRRWHAAWSAAPKVDGVMSEDSRAELFNMAVEIYISRIHDRTTDFPINIEGRIRQDLDAVFGPAVPEGKLSLDGDADPFSTKRQRPTMSAGTNSSDSADTLFEKTGIPGVAEAMKESPVKSSNNALFEPHPCVAPLGKAKATIRAGFNENVFDAAEKSVKYLVLTNTWQKFVKSGEDYYDKEMNSE